MKKICAPLVKIPVIGLILFVLSGCVKDRITKTYTLLKPVYANKSEVLANIKMNAPEGLKTTGKIYVYGNYIFLNEVNKGVHVIDNTNPENPTQIGFINIPGNIDIAVKGHTLLANFNTDLVAIDITNPSQAKLKKNVPDVFPERGYGMYYVAADPSQVIVDWIKKDTTIVDLPENRWMNCDACAFLQMSDASVMAVPPSGVGGSMASFTIVNDYLYAVERHSLKSISIENPEEPTVISTTYAGWDIETIYPMNDKLFLGSMEGLFIFNISNPASPVAEGNFSHARACDPVIADGNYAYVTLRAGTNCGPAKNELLVVDITNLLSPSLIKEYPMTDPHGLAKDDDLLFICDGSDGLKVYDASDPRQLGYLRSISGFESYDVIAFNKIVLVVATDGLYQFDISNKENIRLLSKIAVNH